MMNIHSIMRVVAGVACLGLAQGGLAATEVTVNGTSCGQLTNLTVESGTVSSVFIETDEASCLASDSLPISAKADTFSGIGMGDSILDVLKNDTYLFDPDGNYPLTLQIASQPGGAGLGSVAVSGKSIVYTPPEEYEGQVTFQYSFLQADLSTAPALVTLTVDTTVPVSTECDESNDTQCVFDLLLSNTTTTRKIAAHGKHIYRFTPGPSTVVRGDISIVEMVGYEVLFNMGLSPVSGRSIDPAGDTGSCFQVSESQPEIQFRRSDDPYAEYLCVVGADVEVYLTVENTQNVVGGYYLGTSAMSK